MTDKSNDTCIDCQPVSETAALATDPTLVAKSEQVESVEDVMNPQTFSPPSLNVGPNVYIEYCDRVS